MALSDASTLTAIVTAIGLILTIGMFAYQQFKENRFHKFNIYQNLEFASNEIFRFEAAHSEEIASFLKVTKDQHGPNGDIFIIDSYLYQILNLFELAIKYRKENLLDKNVYGSWVIWKYDILESWYFRQCWREIRLNYTKDLRDIFDGSVDGFDPAMNVADRREKFFSHVAKILKCREISKWLGEARYERTD